MQSPNMRCAPYGTGRPSFTPNGGGFAESATGESIHPRSPVTLAAGAAPRGAKIPLGARRDKRKRRHNRAILSSWSTLLASAAFPVVTAYLQNFWRIESCLYASHLSLYLPLCSPSSLSLQWYRPKPSVICKNASTSAKKTILRVARGGFATLAVQSLLIKIRKKDCAPSNVTGLQNRGLSPYKVACPITHLTRVPTRLMPRKPAYQRIQCHVNT
jgi:hypothetical protein